MLEKVFKLKENGTNAKTEIIAGLTTFMTMAYIIALNPNLLTNFATGSPLWNAVFLATLLSSAIGTFVMAFAANKPFVMAPGMGLNSFFAVVVANIAAILGNLFATQFMLRTEGKMFNLIGIQMHPGQLLPGITGLFIMSLGVIAFFLNKREERLDAIEAAENPPEEEDVFADTSV